MLEGYFHSEHSAVFKVADMLILVEDLYIGIALDVAGSYLALLVSLEENGFGAVSVKLCGN